MYKFSRIVLLVISIYFSSTFSAPQQAPEINDQFQIQNHTEVDEAKSIEKNTQHVETNFVIDDILTPNKTEINSTSIDKPVVGFIAKVVLSVKAPIVEFISVPKVNAVLKNVATCIVNGAMEIVTYYFPAPMIPLIASAAGMVMPFEPVVTLRRRMPVTSYRRAFNAAVDSFMGTFDPYKKPAEDPYMTRRFNRKVWNDVVNDKIELDDKGKDE